MTAHGLAPYLRASPHGCDYGLRSEITGGRADGALANGGAVPSDLNEQKEGKGSYRLPDSLCNGCVGQIMRIVCAESADRYSRETLRSLWTGSHRS